MIIDPNLDDHAAVYAAEVAALEPSDWERWIGAVEKKLGHSVDGDHATDGYSLDGFYDLWEQGVSVDVAVSTAHRQ